MSELDALRKDIPHLIVLVALVVILLVILTKFQWIHCSQIPGWCNAYCSVITRSHSKVAMISGDTGIGNPDDLYNIIQKERGYTYLEKLDVGQMSGGVLKNYDLLVLEKMGNVTTREANAIKDYVDRGGSVLWIGDVAVNQTPDDYDILRAKESNATFFEKLSREMAKRNVTVESQYVKDQLDKWKDTDDYKILVKAGLQKEFDEKGELKPKANPTPSFERLKDVLGARYVETMKQDKPLELRIIDREHLIARGLKPLFSMKATEFAKIAEDPSRVNKIAVVRNAKGEESVGIMEARYAGKIVFIAFPLEEVDSTTLITNTVDYLVPC